MRIKPSYDWRRRRGRGVAPFKWRRGRCGGYLAVGAVRRRRRRDPPPGICIPGRFQRGSRRPPSSARLPGCPKPLFSARREPGVPQGRDELGGPRCGDPALHKVVSAGAVPAGHRGSRSLFPTVGRLVCRKAPSGLLLCAFVFLFFRFCRSSLKQ